MLKAIIIGAGRMGAGRGLAPGAHYYTHAKAYETLKERVKLCAFVEPDPARRVWAAEEWDTGSYRLLEEALEVQKPDIASICVQPEKQVEILKALEGKVKGVWCEKPFVPKSADWPFKIQVNYCRRFDLFHQAMALILREAKDVRLVVMAKKDVHTVCHMTDLARFWNVSQFNYVDTQGEPGAYALRYRIGKDWKEHFFPAGGIAGDDFMTKALANLLDAVEGKAPLISPPENAIQSESLAAQFLKGDK